MKEEIDLKIILPVSVKSLYEAWLDSDLHSAMTGALASVSNTQGAAFSAWDNYIHGRNLELLPHKKIVQSWRTSDFKQGEPDSFLELSFKPVPAGTELHLLHKELPAGSRAQYLQGWQDFYFKPMQAFFEVGGE